MPRLTLDYIDPDTLARDYRPARLALIADILGRAERRLPRRDGQLLRARLADGQSFDALAALLAQPPSAVRRRVDRLLRRITRPTFVLADRFFGRLSRRQQRLVDRRVFAGQSLRRIAASQRTTTHTIRIRLRQVRATLARLERESRSQGSGVRGQGSGEGTRQRSNSPSPSGRGSG